MGQHIYGDNNTHKLVKSHGNIATGNLYYGKDYSKGQGRGHSRVNPYRGARNISSNGREYMA